MRTHPTRPLFLGLLALFSLTAEASPTGHAKPAIAHATPGGPVTVQESEQLKAIIANLLQDNASFSTSHDETYFRPLTTGQSPRATVVTCSDSRVHTHALDRTPDGDLFMVRNIGNQLATAEGSVEYGVHHLHTPLLLFVGHVSCGAIKAASGDYRKESRTIRRELDSIRVPKGGNILSNVQTNVNNQVSAAMKKFAHEIQEGKLTVIGAVYDFGNEMGRGYGKLNVINLNGVTDPGLIAASSLLKGSPEPQPVTPAKPAVQPARDVSTTTTPPPGSGQAYSYP